VDQQLVTVPGQEPFLAPPKTAASMRTVPLPQIVLDALAAHLALCPTDGLVFVNEGGRPIRRTAFGSAWRAAVAAAGASAGTGFHDLRHFYASLLIRHGESVKVVQARLGHASAAETLDCYSHLWPDSEDLTRRPLTRHSAQRQVPSMCPPGLSESLLRRSQPCGDELACKPDSVPA
jgi:integrase